MRRNIYFTYRNETTSWILQLLCFYLRHETKSSWQLKHQLNSNQFWNWVNLQIQSHPTVQARYELSHSEESVYFSLIDLKLLYCYPIRLPHSSNPESATMSFIPVKNLCYWIKLLYWCTKFISLRYGLWLVYSLSFIGFRTHESQCLCS